MYTDILFRYTTEEEFFAAMQTLDIQCAPENRPEEQMQHCGGYPIVTHQGIVRMVRFTDPDQLAKVPEVLTPTMLIDWRSDEEEYYDPSYTADLVDAEGNLYVGPVFAARIAS